MSNIFNVFVPHLDVPVTCNAYRGNNGNIVVYETRAEAEAAAAQSVGSNSVMVKEMFGFLLASANFAAAASASARVS